MDTYNMQHSAKESMDTYNSQHSAKESMDTYKLQLFDISRLHAVLTAANNYIAKQTHPDFGLQIQYCGTSRDNLQEVAKFPGERFTSLLALDLLDNKISPRISSTWHHSAGSNIIQEPTVNYFYDNSTYPLPDDIDCTSLFYLANKERVQEDKLNEVAERMLGNTFEENGTLQTYFSPRGHHVRVDECANANGMRFLYSVGMDSRARATEDALYRYLVSRQYLRGTRYYESPDTFLYFLSRAVSKSDRARARFIAPLTKEIVSRLGTTDYPLDAAQRILALYFLNVLDRYRRSGIAYWDLKTMINGQMQDGGWEADALFKIGANPVYLGGRETPTVFALAALKAVASTTRRFST